LRRRANGKTDTPCRFDTQLSRREFCALLAGVGAAACFGPEETGGPARLSARPGAITGSVTPGLNRLGTGEIGDGYLYVPASYQPDTPMPLLLAFHGAGGSLLQMTTLLEGVAESHGFLIVGVNSTAPTWDGIAGRFGPDVRRIDTALSRAFARCRVDPARLAVGGFSDGATYALAVGLANGDFFPRVIAFSPGFALESDSPRAGQPEFFISHGLQDSVLPIDYSSRVISRSLEAAGYEVTFTEFEGGHEVPEPIRQSAAEWLLR
jgi:predicted esterase